MRQSAGILLIMTLLSGSIWCSRCTQFQKALKEKKWDKARTIVEKMNPEEINQVIPDSIEITPLIAAIQADRIDLVRLILDRGAKVNLAGSTGETPLHKAVRSQNLSLIDLLIERGADLEARDRQGQTPIFMALHSDSEKKTIMEMTLKQMMNSPAETRTILTREILMKLISHLVHLVDKGADVNTVRGDGYTPLLYCLEKNRWFQAVYLLSNGADFNRSTPSGKSPISLALGSQYPGMVLILGMMDAKVGPSELSSLVSIACSQFSKYKSPLLLKVYAYLLKNGMRDEKGELFSLMDYAVFNRTAGLEASELFEIMRLCIDSGMDCNHESSRGTSLFFNACHRVGQGENHDDWLDIVSIMVDRGARLDVPFTGLDSHWDKGETVLMHAIKDRDESLIELLVNRGARLSSQQADEMTTRLKVFDETPHLTTIKNWIEKARQN